MSAQDFLVWLSSGMGSSVIISYVLERWTWFQAKTAEFKKLFSISLTSLLAIGAYVALQYIPVDFWALISPYWNIVMVVLGLYGIHIGVELFHKFDKAEG